MPDSVQGSAADETPDQAALDSINAVVEHARPDDDELAELIQEATKDPVVKAAFEAAEARRTTDPLVWTVDMALLVALPCPRCERTERCRCHVPLAERTRQRAEYIAARVRERFPHVSD